ncbi:hypothetical protein [uncultured Clostridium sp.]|uniref:hypothetical protein n=1 Tax=uncultured Clostridium sp. TaxID=59620 RepID=UPI0026060EBF|nr:hypothetical protein [uncultured Clostridium sp.]
MRFSSNKRGFIGNLGLASNFFVELVIFMSIFASIGIIIQSEGLIALGFIISVVLSLLVNYLKIKPIIVYLISVPVLIILLIFIPKILI